nr:iron ABC transporter permease [Paenibacillus solanacearum]
MRPARRIGMAQFAVVLAGLAVLLLAGLWLSLNSGYTRLAFGDVIQALLRQRPGDPTIIMWGIRLPRIVLAMLVGAGLAASGAIMQGVSQNALADPGILGVNAGAGLGVVVYVTLFYGKVQLAPVHALPVAAFLGAAAAALTVFALARKRMRITPTRLLLVGMATGAGISAAMLLFTHRMDAYSYDLVKVWMSGSIWGANWRYVAAAGLWVALLLPAAIYRAGRMNVLNMGDELATGVGLAVQRERLILLLLGVGLASSGVAVAGTISFVGLIGPHLARRFVGHNYRFVLPTAACFGALLVLLADTIGRTVVQPTEIPVGIVVAAIGGPYFLYLLFYQR